MSLRIGKTFTFDAAHQLPKHEGKCRNVHGHTYKLEVVIQGVLEFDDDIGMFMDFGDVSKIVKETVLDRIDHSFIWNGRMGQGQASIHSQDVKIFDLGKETTAENLTLAFFGMLEKQINTSDGKIKLYAVTVWETPTSWASFTSHG